MSRLPVTILEQAPAPVERPTPEGEILHIGCNRSDPDVWCRSGPAEWTKAGPQDQVCVVCKGLGDEMVDRVYQGGGPLCPYDGQPCDEDCE